MKYGNIALEIVGDGCSSKTAKAAVQLCCSVMDLWDTELVELVSQREKCYEGFLTVVYRHNSRRCHAVSHIHCSSLRHTLQWGVVQRMEG